MLDGSQLHLRNERRTRHPHWWRLPLLAGFVSFVIGVACLEPLAPTVLAPLVSPADVPNVVPEQAAAPALPVLGAPVVAAKAAPVTAAPPLVTLPVPAVLPTLSSSGQAMLDGIKADVSARWLKNHTETALRSGPND